MFRQRIWIGVLVLMGMPVITGSLLWAQEKSIGRAREKDKIEKEYLGLNRVLAEMDSAGSSMNIVLLESFWKNHVAENSDRINPRPPNEEPKWAFYGASTWQGVQAVKSDTINSLWTQMVLEWMMEEDSNLLRMPDVVHSKMDKATAITPSLLRNVFSQDTADKAEVFFFRPDTTSLQRENQRVALVIGNGDYNKSNFQTLPTPTNDADSMAATLEVCGFKVLIYKNLNRNDMIQAVRAFGDSIKCSEVGLFYYSGHGFPKDNEYYLVPVDADMQLGMKDIITLSFIVLLGLCGIWDIVCEFRWSRVGLIDSINDLAEKGKKAEVADFFDRGKTVSFSNIEIKGAHDFSDLEPECNSDKKKIDSMRFISALLLKVLVKEEPRIKYAKWLWKRLNSKLKNPKNNKLLEGILGILPMLKKKECSVTYNDRKKVFAVLKSWFNDSYKSQSPKRPHYLPYTLVSITLANHKINIPRSLKSESKLWVASTQPIYTVKALHKLFEEYKKCGIWICECKFKKVKTSSKEKHIICLRLSKEHGMTNQEAKNLRNQVQAEWKSQGQKRGSLTPAFLLLFGLAKDNSYLKLSNTTFTYTCPCNSNREFSLKYQACDIIKITSSWPI